MDQRMKKAFLLLCMVAMLCANDHAEEKGHLRKIWKLRIADILPRSKGFNSADIVVLGLGFSPDGERIVAVVGQSRKEETVLVFNIADPKTNFRKLEINPEFYESEFPAWTRAILWSKTGQKLILNRFLIDLSNNSSCTLPKGLHRFSTTAIVRAAESEFRFFDWQCNNTEYAERLKFSILDASEERELLCITQNSAVSAPVDIVEACTLKPLMRVPVSREPFPNIARFAESGKVVCGTNGSLWEQDAACWEVDTGKEISRSRRHSQLDMLPSLHSSRIILTEYGRKFDFIELRWALGSVKKRIVWDCLTGQELASWRPKFQREKVSFRDGSANIYGHPYRIAISPDGRFIAEGGAGEIFYQRIE